MTSSEIDKPAQNPHATRKNRENNLEIAIGRQIKDLRTRKQMTGAELSKSTGISIGMLSKIENGLTSPSLTTLQSLAHSLQVPLTSFFSRFEEIRESVLVKSGEGIETDRQGTRAGHQYSLLGHLISNTGGVTVEPYLITLTATSDVFSTFQHDGAEFIYMLEGSVGYLHGVRTVVLTKGDSFFFDADSPHGPVELIDLPARYLSVISYRSLPANQL